MVRGRTAVAKPPPSTRAPKPLCLWIASCLSAFVVNHPRPLLILASWRLGGSIRTSSETPSAPGQNPTSALRLKVGRWAFGVGRSPLLSLASWRLGGSIPPMRTAAAALVLLPSLCLAQAPAPWADFESASLSTGWQVRAEASASRVDAPPGATPGKALRIEARGRAVIQSKPDTLPLGAIQKCEEVILHIWRDEKDPAPLEFDVMFLEPDERATLWRKVVVPAAGWQRVALPLPWFRWGTGRVPRWDKVSSFAIRTRGPSAFTVDDITFIDRDPQTGADVSPAQIAEAAFQQKPAPGAIRVSDSLWLCSNEPALDLDALSRHLHTVLAAMQADLDLPKEPAHRPGLVIFSQRDAYAAFVTRLGTLLEATAAPPTSDGYHLQGIALSSWKPEAGTLRPVFTHEFCHSVLSHFALIDSAKSDWWQEGVANCYQLRYHPQPTLGDIVRQSLANPESRSRFQVLCSGDSVPMNRYWQVATLVEMMLSTPAYRANLPKLLSAFRDSGSTDLRPHLEPILGKTWDQLTTDWATWCQQNYPAPK